MGWKGRISSVPAGPLLRRPKYCFPGTGESAKLFRDNQPGLLAEAVQYLHIKPLTQCRNAGRVSTVIGSCPSLE
jgi:hypothetical protein